MAVARGTVTGYGIGGSGLPIKLRVQNLAGSNITQATLSTITYSVRDMTAREDKGTGTLTIASVVYDTLQTDSTWTEDNTGYNFAWTVPASLTGFEPDGDYPRDDVPPHEFAVDLLFTPSSGEAFKVPVRVEMQATW